MLIIEAELHKILARLANQEDPDQTASLEAQEDLVLHCLPSPFGMQLYTRGDQKVCRK